MPSCRRGDGTPSCNVAPHCPEQGRTRSVGQGEIVPETDGSGRRPLRRESGARITLCGCYGSLLLKRCLSTLSERIFDSSVDRGIPSLAAAPVGSDTRPFLAATADSTRDLPSPFNSSPSSALSPRP